MSAATSAIADIETSASYVRRPFDFDMRAVGGLGPWPLGALGGWFGARTCWGVGSCLLRKRYEETDDYDHASFFPATYQKSDETAVATFKTTY